MPSVDIWAIGCILAEMILRRILFPGTDRLDQWTKITSVLGTPSKEFIDRFASCFCSFFCWHRCAHHKSTMCSASWWVCCTCGLCLWPSHFHMILGQNIIHIVPSDWSAMLLIFKKSKQICITSGQHINLLHILRRHSRAFSNLWTVHQFHCGRTELVSGRKFGQPVLQPFIIATASQLQIIAKYTEDLATSSRSKIRQMRQLGQKPQQGSEMAPFVSFTVLGKAQSYVNIIWQGRLGDFMPAASVAP